MEGLINILKPCGFILATFTITVINISLLLAPLVAPFIGLIYYDVDYYDAVIIHAISVIVSFSWHFLIYGFMASVAASIK